MDADQYQLLFRQFLALALGVYHHESYPKKAGRRSDSHIFPSALFASGHGIFMVHDGSIWCAGLYPDVKNHRGAGLAADDWWTVAQSHGGGFRWDARQPRTNRQLSKVASYADKCGNTCVDGADAGRLWRWDEGYRWSKRGIRAWSAEWAAAQELYGNLVGARPRDSEPQNAGHDRSEDCWKGWF